MGDKNGGQEVGPNEFNLPTGAKPKRIIKKATPKQNNKTKTKLECQKSRTPSGQVLSTSVKDIRNFFLDKSALKGKIVTESHSPM